MRLSKHPVAVVTAILALVLVMLASPPAAGAKPTPGTISGTVTYRGKPLAGAVVILASDENRTRTRTDAKGRFATKVAPGSYIVSAWTGKHSVFTTFAGNTTREPDAVVTKVRAGRTARVSVNLVRAATVTGRVVGAKGRPVKAVLEPSNPSRQTDDTEVRTDAKGRYTITGLPPGQVTMHAWAARPGGHMRRGEVTVRARRGHTVTAPVIRLAKVRRPQGTITVEVDRQSPTERVFAYQPRTGSWIELEHRPKKQVWSGKVPTGRWRVTVGGSNVATQTVRVRKGRTVHAGHLDARRTRTDLTGQVLGTDGRPVADGHASATDRFGLPAGWSALDAEGRFTFPGLAPGRHTVTAHSARSAQGLPVTADVRITAGAPQTIDLHLEQGYTVRGRVLHRGKGVAGVRVTLLPDSTTTGRKGRFRLEGIPQGTHLLRVRDQHDFGYRFKDVVVQVEGSTKGVRVKVKR